MKRKRRRTANDDHFQLHPFIRKQKKIYSSVIVLVVVVVAKICVFVDLFRSAYILSGLTDKIEFFFLRKKVPKKKQINKRIKCWLYIVYFDCMWLCVT